MKQLFAKLWSMRHEFIKYFTIGFTAFILDVGSLGVLKHYIGLNPTFAVMLNQPPILLFVFYLNKHWSFKAAGLTHRQLVRFLTVAATNYVIAVVWMGFFTHVVHIDIILSQHLSFITPTRAILVIRTCNIALAVAWNFLLYKFWVYTLDTSSEILT